jgi:hypothetical protein
MNATQADPGLQTAMEVPASAASASILGPTPSLQTTDPIVLSLR